MNKKQGYYTKLCVLIDESTWEALSQYVHKQEGKDEDGMKFDHIVEAIIRSFLLQKDV